MYDRLSFAYEEYYKLVRNTSEEKQAKDMKRQFTEQICIYRLE